MEHVSVKMKVNGINLESSEDVNPSCVDCIAKNNTKLCQAITDAHEVITGNSTCRDCNDNPIIWNEVG